MEILKFSEEHLAFEKRLEAFIDFEVIPNIQKWEKDKIVPKSVWRQLGENGFLCPNLPKKYGGTGGDFLHSVLVAKQLARSNFNGLATFIHSDIVVPYIEAYGTEKQLNKYLPGCVTGDIITAVGMTEPDSGSDLASMNTTAVEDGDSFVINGTKTFISNGVNCDLVVLAAINPEGDNPHKAVSLFLVEDGTKGFTKGKPLEKMGWKSQDTAELFFSDCRIPKENLLGSQGNGFKMLMAKLQQERLICSVSAMYFCENMLKWTVEYLKNKGALNSQVARFALSEMGTEITVGNVYMEKLVEEHMKKESIIVETSMGKYFTTDLVKRISLRCLELIGDFGSLEECPVARTFRDSRITSIFAGTNEIMKEIIAKFSYS
ncbi:MAG: acyl-CoA dehydrogenase [Desulfobacterales bacterium]|nr:acyl-CoA dehydrogenase [Desulfobacterales bacterium]MCP4159584.1 acyl-CoA dehydrogenase [Deltaproteobacteria bacterium]